MSNTHLTSTLAALRTDDAARSRPSLIDTNWIAIASEDEFQQLLRGMAQLASQDQLDDHAAGVVMRAICQSPSWQQTDSSFVDATVRPLYLQLGAQSPSRHLLLTVLAQRGDDECLKMFADLLAVDPPSSSERVVEACAPLWTQENLAYSALFPRVLDALSHPAAAAVVIDLTNFLAASGRITEHPALSRREQLVDLFGKLIERLEGFEEQSIKHGVADLDAAQQVADAVSLAVALCYTFSLTKEEEAIGKLYRMLDLRHRRLRVEAATALARLKEEAGSKVLIEMASEPSVRLSVLAHAAELGMLDEIDAEYRTPIARAEAELVSHLSQPGCFGIPPNECEMIDARTLSWPSFDEPVDCFLFRFCYQLPIGEVANLGIVGPMAHCFSADLTHLDFDDAYSTFAGWQAEHEEIREIQIDPMNPTQAVEVQRLSRGFAAADAEMDSIQPVFIGDFFGDRYLVASASADGEPGSAVISPDDFAWFARGNAERPFGPELAYAAYKGRRLLRMFNDAFGTERD